MPVQPHALRRCPGCGAAARPAAPWCTQCWTDLRPSGAAPAPAAAARPGHVPSYERGQRAASDRPAHAPVPEQDEHPAPATWPCLACGTAVPLAAPGCPACGTAFLAAADALPRLVLPLVGDLGRLPRPQRLLLAGGAVVLIGLLTALLGLLPA